MRSDKHTVNGLEAYILGTTESASLEEVTGCTVDKSTESFHIGIRVYIRHADGSETEVTPGSTVAIAELPTGADTTTTISGTWDCPDTSLSDTDAIVVRVRCVCGTGWTEGAATTIAEFITEQLGATKLDASTWTVYYRVRRDEVYNPILKIYYWDYYFRFGISGDDSYIEGFSYSVVAKLIRCIGDGLTWIVG